MSDDPILEAKHNIFLSHSGVQKEFVEHLCKALEDCCYYPFFDRRPGSLPKGKEFPSLIVKAAQQCRLLVVVVSEEYFMSKWPMIELNTFVQVSKVLKSNTNVAILPLFYGLSLSDLMDKKRRQRWSKKWITFAKDDIIEGRIKVEDWWYAVDELTKFNGLSYNRELKEIVAYENEIVSHICKLVPPDVKWDDSHVRGHAHEVIFDKMKQIGLSQKYKVKVVGIYGVGGIGKTTTCKTLCNKLSSEYAGRVCHTEFEIKCLNSKELWQNAVMKLLRKSADFVRQLDEGECEDILHKNLFKQQTFLAIDNVWDDGNSIKQAKMFLKTPSHEDSLVLVTARSQSTLALLKIDGDACFEMPELGRVDVTRLFLYYASDGEESSSKEYVPSFKFFVQKCYFCKGDGRKYHYHPLALEALGRQFASLDGKPSERAQLLYDVWKHSSFPKENILFDALRSNFVLLEPIEQTLFMDVGIFLLHIDAHSKGLWRDWIGWKEKLCVLYKKDAIYVQSQLDSLKRKGLLQDANLASGRINMHDLYREFVSLEAAGNFGAATNIKDRKWVLIDKDDGDLSELEVTPSGGCWQELSRLSIREKEADSMDRFRFGYRSPTNFITSLEEIKWQYFSNVLVLQLYGLRFVQGTLNLKGMTCLRSLELYKLKCLQRLEGLESLKHLTCFIWEILPSSRDDTREMHVVGQFPASLKYFYMQGQCVLSGSDVRTHCSNLIKLKLHFVKVGKFLDLSNCLSLESVQIHKYESFQTLSRHIATRSSKLQTLEIDTKCGIHILGLDQLNALVQLYVVDMDILWEVPCLTSLTMLQALSITTHSKLAEHCIPHQLQKLYYKWWAQCEAPVWNAFKQLQVLDFSYSSSLTQMYGLGDLSALQSLSLFYCDSLKQLPDLSKSRTLKELNLDCCNGLKLHEEDFDMLKTLPSLYPVRFSRGSDRRKIRLDFFEEKVLRHLYNAPDFWLAWKEGEWEELELGLPPIEMGNRGIWDNYVLIKYEDSEDYEALEDVEYDMEELEDECEELKDPESDIEYI